jgi:hypothetical protein
MALNPFLKILYKKKEEFSFLLLFFFYITIIFFNSQGTHNTEAWIEWVEYANKYGIIEGYKYKVTTYPPLSVLILKFFYNLTSFFNHNIEIFYAIKISIFFFFFLSTIIIYFYSSNIKITIFYIVTFLLSSVGLNDLDIFFATFLIISFFFLKKKNFFLFSFFFIISILIKWQPIIIAPILIIYVSEYNLKNKINFRNIKHAFVAIFFVSLMIIGTYGFLPIVKSLYVSINHNYLSGNALNYNWIITWFLKTYDSASYGNIINGQITWTKIKSNNIYIYSGQFIFILTYFYLLLNFIFLKKKNLESLFLFCSVVSFSYYIFNKGVHQNHLFLSTLFVILAYNENSQNFVNAVLTSVIFNMNLFIFYGVTGTSIINTVVNNSFDLTLIISILNVLFLIKIFINLNAKIKINQLKKLI